MNKTLPGLFVSVCRIVVAIEAQNLLVCFPLLISLHRYLFPKTNVHLLVMSAFTLQSRRLGCFAPVVKQHPFVLRLFCRQIHLSPPFFYLHTLTAPSVVSLIAIYSHCCRAVDINLTRFMCMHWCCCHIAIPIPMSIESFCFTYHK